MKILAIAGTRPEAIKMAPVVQRLRAEPDRFEVRLCVTAQHREMLDQVLGLFGLVPEIDLDLMRPDQSLNEVASRVFASLDAVLQREQPEWLLVQGDTTSSMAAALVAFHRHVRVGHVEAGLRTNDFERPFPEEMNRRVTDLVASAAFAPTRRAADALRREGVPPERIHLTGNTVVDALETITAREKDVAGEDLVLITAHRRESFGEPLRRILRSVETLAGRFPSTRFVHIVHPNPRVLEAVGASRELPNVERIGPVDYLSLIRLVRRARLVLTDSGGIQEEAPSFGIPVLVLREKTERPEGLEAGFARLVGTDEEKIVRDAARLLARPCTRERMRASANPYGDGHASDRIADALAGRPFSPFRAATAAVDVV